MAMVTHVTSAYAPGHGFRGEPPRPVVEPPERRKVGRHPPDGSAGQHELKHVRHVHAIGRSVPVVSAPPQRTHLDRPDLGDRMAGRDLDRFVEAAALDDVEAADDLLRLREWSVRDELLALAHANG